MWEIQLNVGFFKRKWENDPMCSKYFRTVHSTLHLSKKVVNTKTSYTTTKINFRNNKIPRVYRKNQTSSAYFNGTSMQSNFTRCPPQNRTQNWFKHTKITIERSCDRRIFEIRVFPTSHYNDNLISSPSRQFHCLISSYSFWSQIKSLGTKIQTNRKNVSQDNFNYYLCY